MLKKYFRKVYVIKDIFLILVIVSVNVINLVVLVNIWIIQVISVKKKIIDSLAENCTNNIDETNLVETILDKNENKDQCSSYVVYKVLFLIFFIINIGIGIYFAYYKYINHSKKVSKYDYTYQTTIY